MTLAHNLSYRPGPFTAISYNQQVRTNRAYRRVSTAAPRICCSSSPKRGVLILPGLGNNDQDYNPLAELLRRKNLVVETAQVSRADW